MRIAIVNDMLLAVECLRRALASSGEHEIAWIARDGEEAVAKAIADSPELILMDLFMPKMGGVEATQEIMRRKPCPILIVTGDIDQHAGAAFEAMGAGALDAINTPVCGDAQASMLVRDLLGKIDTIRRLSRYQSVTLPTLRDAPADYLHPGPLPPLVVIGASSGGPQALADLLAALPREPGAAFVVVQHVDAQFAPALAEWLGQRTELRVATAKEGDQPALGTVLVAATNDHIICDEKHSLRYTPWPLNNVYRPSVDVFFSSVACNWQHPVLGILLTGMGYDGAEGLLALKNAGHMTLAQDQASCAVFGMPKAAMQLGAASKMVPLSELGAEISAWAQMQCEPVEE